MANFRRESLRESHTSGHYQSGRRRCALPGIPIRYFARANNSWDAGSFLRASLEATFCQRMTKPHLLHMRNYVVPTQFCAATKKPLRCDGTRATCQEEFSISRSHDHSLGSKPSMHCWLRHHNAQLRAGCILVAGIVVPRKSLWLSISWTGFLAGIVRHNRKKRDRRHKESNLHTRTQLLVNQTNEYLEADKRLTFVLAATLQYSAIVHKALLESKASSQSTFAKMVKEEEIY